jgi:high-affinity K+ transport system ATPase subunit B
VNFLGNNIDTIKKNTETLIDVSKVSSLKVNTKESKYTLLSRHQNTGQNHDIKIVKRIFENVAQLKYSGTTVTNTKLIQKEIKKRINSVQNLLSSRLLSKNVKIRICKTIILPVVL